VTPAPSRRDFLQTLIAGAGIAALRPDLHAATALSTARLSDSLAVVSGAGGNVVVATAPDGLLLVNGGARAHATAPMAELSSQFGGKTVRTLINTDWHPHHTGVNAQVRKSGAQILAHEYTKQYMSRAGMKDGLPTKTFYTSDTLPFGGGAVECGQLGQAHTDGDIYVFFRAQNVLAVGDMLSLNAYPIADVNAGGWLGGMVTATKTLLDLTDAATKVVPGSGPVQSREALDAQHRMLAAVRERFVKMMRQGMSADDMLAAGITKDFDPVWGDPKEFISSAYRGMWLHVRELGGIV
jgi:glyoxylase-like metal-dependent hydrolase (beta-lactamase superfamily II)